MRSAKSWIHLFSVALALTICLPLGCSSSKSGVAKKDPRFEKPFPEDDPSDPIPFTWQYLGLNGGSALTTCARDFLLDGSCASRKFEMCRLGKHEYICQPEDLEIRLRGQVLDENLSPLVGAEVFAGDSLEPDLWHTSTLVKGRFTLKTFGGNCPPTIYAALDGWTDLNGAALAKIETKCQRENFVGSNQLLFTLRASPRTAPPEPPPISNYSSCRITGRVTNSSGNGISEAKVSAGEWTSTSDEKGNYMVSGDGPCPRLCSAQKSGYASRKPQLSGRAFAACRQGQPADLILDPL